ncbi:hypothetical protein [Raoultella ornithinolytica]|uniref:hypothetical protein n=1 Tax=Raoultella ornithinolytica TaxID=54291 RepID=UPI00224E35AF|nr:hypothetical protein [Raoultella ornithinolytica]MCX3410623.1 hypothetical protein [Raoultella ornithinolytica]
MKLNNVFSALVLASGLATFGAQADQGSGMGLGMTGFANRCSGLIFLRRKSARLTLIKLNLICIMPVTDVRVILLHRLQNKENQNFIFWLSFLSQRNNYSRTLRI